VLFSIAMKNVMTFNIIKTFLMATFLFFTKDPVVPAIKKN